MREQGARQAEMSQLLQIWDDKFSPGQHDFASFVAEGFKGNGPIYSLVSVKAFALSEVEFATLNADRELGPPPLALSSDRLGRLVSEMEIDADLAGTAFQWLTPDGDWLRMRPDRVEVVWGEELVGGMVKPTILGFLYWRDGKNVGRPVPVPAEEVAVYAPIPDPTHPFLGQSWIQSVAVEGDSDNLMSRHKALFFKNAATPNVAVLAEKKLDPEVKKVLRDQFTQRHEGWENAYRTVFLEGGADIRVLGQNMEQMSFVSTQAGGETRLAAASGVPPVVVGFLQGIQSATYSNYSQAMRRFADLTCRPRWRLMCNALAGPVGVRTGERLWYDDRNVAFLQQDAKDAAEIDKERALTAEAYIRAGFEPESVIASLETGDITKLVHTGLTSVQLLPPGENGDGGPDEEVGDG
jgi:hypothetical protein